MQIRLKDLAIGTVFSLEGEIWRADSGWWGYPTPSGKGYLPELKGLPCRRCTPKAGGQFQEAIQRWIPENKMVEVASDFR